MRPYDTTLEPPAIIMDSEVQNPSSSTSVKRRAKLDTGADISVIPEDLVGSLELVPAATVSTHAFDCSSDEHRTYFVNILLNGMRFEYVEVVAAGREVLVGRDILNQLKILLDGKSQSFDVQDP